jgi:hypothetical protein
MNATFSAPGEVYAIVDAMVAHLKAWKPTALLVVEAEDGDGR